MSEPVFPFDQDVTRVRREKVAVDKYGNDVRAPVGTLIPGVVIWPEAGTSEVEGDRDTVTSGLMMLLPVGVDVTATDKFIVGTKDYQVHGEPADYEFSPFTGSRAGHLVRLRRVTG